MTKEELKQEAQEYYEDETEGTFQICEDCYWFADAVQTAYVDSAEPREREIKSLGERCLQLQKDKGELIDKVRDLEEKLANADYQLEGRDLEIKELKAQIEKMKSCTNCINNYFLATEEPCCSCTRCYASTTKKTTDKWEIKEK